MQVKHLLTFIFILLTQLLYSQEGFQSGSVVTRSGELIHGEINNIANNRMSVECIFRDTLHNKVKYTPNDIYSYQFDEGRHFVSEEVDGEHYFLEYLIEGGLSIYHFKKNGNDVYLLQKQGGELVPIPFEQGIKGEGKKQRFFKSQKHKGVLGYATKEAPELQSLIDKMVQPNHENLTELAKQYNDIVCPDEECILYMKPKRKAVYIVEAVGMWSRYEYDLGVTPEFTDHMMQMGANVYVNPKFVNKKLFLKLGLQYRRLEHEEGSDKNEYHVPIALAYMHQKGFLRPTASIGRIFTTHGTFLRYVDVGCNVHISENCAMSVRVDWGRYNRTAPKVGLMWRL